jgi:hypothetical protein
MSLSVTLASSESLATENLQGILSSEITDFHCHGSCDSSHLQNLW